MSQNTDARPMLLVCGARVRICDETLQAFYGEYGTIVRVATCRRKGNITYIGVQMDNLPATERYGSFYPHEVRPLLPSETVAS